MADKIESTTNLNKAAIAETVAETMVSKESYEEVRDNIIETLDELIKDKNSKFHQNLREMETLLKPLLKEFEKKERKDKHFTNLAQVFNFIGKDLKMIYNIRGQMQQLNLDEDARSDWGKKLVKVESLINDTRTLITGFPKTVFALSYIVQGRRYFISENSFPEGQLQQIMTRYIKYDKKMTDERASFTNVNLFHQELEKELEKKEYYQRHFYAISLHFENLINAYITSNGEPKLQKFDNGALNEAYSQHVLRCKQNIANKETVESLEKLNEPGVYWRHYESPDDVDSMWNLYKSRKSTTGGNTPWYQGGDSGWFQSKHLSAVMIRLGTISDTFNFLKSLSIEWDKIKNNRSKKERIANDIMVVFYTKKQLKKIAEGVTDAFAAYFKDNHIV